MDGACGTVREKASDSPEPGAVARSQSFRDAVKLRFARKMPSGLAVIDATVCHRPLLPCRSWIVTSLWLLVASRPQILTLPARRYATNGNRNAVRLGFARAVPSDGERK
jgi:hypothetical protein